MNSLRYHLYFFNLDSKRLELMIDFVVKWNTPCRTSQYSPDSISHVYFINPIWRALQLYYCEQDTDILPALIDAFEDGTFVCIPQPSIPFGLDLSCVPITITTEKSIQEIKSTIQSILFSSNTLKVYYGRLSLFRFLFDMIPSTNSLCRKRKREGSYSLSNKMKKLSMT